MKNCFRFVLLLFFVSGGLWAAEMSTPKKSYNLLFLMTDQHRYDVLGAAGNTVVKTPNLDALAADGVYFAAAYSPCPVCTPARACMLTGRSLYSTKITNNEQANSTVSETPFGNMLSYDEILNKNGFFSAYHGKWHVPVYRAGLFKPTDTGIYHHFGYALLNEDTGRYVNNELSLHKELVKKKAPMDLSQLKDGLQYFTELERPYAPVSTDKRFGKPSPAALEKQAFDDNGHLISQGAVIGKLFLDAELSTTSFQRDLVLTALDDAKKSGRPFNVTASINHPHPPVVAVEPYFSLYRDADNRPIKELDALIPVSIDDRSKNAPYNLRGIVLRAQADYADRNKITDAMSVYYGLITEADDAVGKIVQKLKEIGEYDNTLIIYTSDHGEMLGAHGLSGKGFFYEESARVPLIIKLPKSELNGTHKGERIDRPVLTTDLFATILDYTIGDTKSPSDGKSLRPLIENPNTAENKDYIVSQWGADGVPPYCIATRDWKLMVSRWDHVKSALYDLKNDPHELINLLLDTEPEKREQYRETAEKLKGKLLEYMNEVNHFDRERIKDRDILANTKIRKPFEIEPILFSRSTTDGKAFLRRLVNGSLKAETTFRNTGQTAKNVLLVVELYDANTGTVSGKPVEKPLGVCRKSVIVQNDGKPVAAELDVEIKNAAATIAKVYVAEENSREPLNSAVFLKNEPLEEFVCDIHQQRFVNMSLGKRAGDRTVVSQNYGKRRSRKLTAANLSKNTAVELYVNVDNAKLYDESNFSSKILTITYLDEGTEPFDIQYITPDDLANERNSRVSVTKKNTGLWKTQRFFLKDALFFDRFPGGADFRILGGKTEDNYISRIEITFGSDEL